MGLALAGIIGDVPGMVQLLPQNISNLVHLLELVYFVMVSSIEFGWPNQLYY